MDLYWPILLDTIFKCGPINWKTNLKIFGKGIIFGWYAKMCGYDDFFFWKVKYFLSSLPKHGPMMDTYQIIFGPHAKRWTYTEQFFSNMWSWNGPCFKGSMSQYILLLSQGVDNLLCFRREQIIFKVIFKANTVQCQFLRNNQFFYFSKNTRSHIRSEVISNRNLSSILSFRKKNISTCSFDYNEPNLNEFAPFNLN